MKKTDKLRIGLWLLVIVYVAICYSCNARKSETTKKEETTKTDIAINSDNSNISNLEYQAESNIKTNSVTKADQLNQSQSDELTVEPIDFTKLSVYTDPSGKKHVLENAKMTNKKNKQETKTNSSNSSNSDKFHKAELNYQNEQKAKTAAKLKSEKELFEKNKIVQNEGFSFWNYSLLLLPLALAVVAWKVYKKLNPIV